MDDIVKKLGSIEKSIRVIKGTMATKEDLKTMATKEDLKTMATKEDLKILESGLKGDMRALESGLKGDMKALESDMKILESGLKGDMRALESGLKGDMKALEVRLTERIEEAQMEIIAAVDKHKADKESVKVLEKRVERLEDNAGLPPYVDQ